MTRNLALYVVASVFVTACGAGVGDEIPSTPGEYQCGKDNCQNGCCFENICYPGKAANACGKEGAQCASCVGINSCDAQQCIQDLDSYWRIEIQGTVIASKDPQDQADWDVDGSAPDVVVELACPPPAGTDFVVVTTPETEGFNPAWSGVGCSTKAEALLDMPLRIKVTDIDALVDDDIASLSHQVTEADFNAGFVVTPAAGGMSTLTLRLTRAQVTLP